MNDPISQQPVPPQLITPKKGFPWGCLFGGCFLILAFVVIGTGTVGYLGYRYYIAQVNKYTAAEKAEIPVIETSAEEAAAIKKRFDDFTKAVESDQAVEPLVLTANDVNTLINTNEDFKGKIFITIADGQISAQASVPADFVPGAKGRYFNGRISLKASLENGILIVTLEDAEVNGESLPAEFMNSLRNENLAKDAYKDPKNAEALRKFERLVIEDDKIILIPAPVPATRIDEQTAAPETSEQAETTDSPAEPPDSQSNAEAK